MLRVNGIDCAPKRAADQVPQDRSADAAGLIGCPDNGYALRREKHIEALVFVVKDVKSRIGGAGFVFGHDLLPLVF
jgi:hypothetical protein